MPITLLTTTTVLQTTLANPVAMKKRAYTARTRYDTTKFKNGGQDMLNLNSAHCARQATHTETCIRGAHEDAGSYVTK